EFVKAGFTEVRSERVKPPRVKESPVSFECRVLEVKILGTEGGSGNLAICEVVLIHAQDFIFDEQGKIDPTKSDNVARMGGDYYCRVNGDNIFALPKPGIPPGIGVDHLPPDIRNSSVLTGNNLGKLAGIDKIPSSGEVKDFAENFNYALIGQDNTMDSVMAIHKYAQTLLSQGEIKEAWLLLLSIGYHAEKWS
ncbi:MAG: flavin reductase, partial [Marivirga sp.]|nr:flavin reductase [Marivirga sp.]